MSILKKILSRGNPLENPAVSLANPPAWLINAWGGAPTDSGENVSAMTALQVTTVNACVRLIAEGVAQLPLRVLEQLDRGFTVAKNHPLYTVLADEPNPEMTSSVYFEVCLVHALLWGNSYAHILRNGVGQVVALYPKKPWLTKPVRMPDGTLAYETTDTGNGNKEIIPASDMIFIPGISLDGLVGSEPINLSRQTIGLAMASVRHAERFFGNGAVTSGTLEYPGELSDVAYSRLKSSVENQNTGSNVQRPMILEGGAKWNPIAQNNVSSQFIESRIFQRSEICSLFKVPIEMIASDATKGVKSNSEQIYQQFITFTLQPWLVKFEKEFKKKLFPKNGRNANRFEVKFYDRALSVADSASRMNYYSVGRNAGILTINDCREMEFLPLIGPEGDELMIPLNTQAASQLLKQDPIPAKTDVGNDPEINSLTYQHWTPLFEDALLRGSAAIKPLLAAISGDIRSRLNIEIDLESVELNKAISGYTSGLENRTNTGKFIDAQEEIERVVKLLTHGLLRDAATAKAKIILTDK